MPPNVRKQNVGVEEAAIIVKNVNLMIVPWNPGSMERS